MGISVIGCGNPYATDDGVGLAVIRSLQQLSLPEEVTLIEAGCPGLNLLDLWKKTDSVLLVDAVLSGAEPGTIHCFGPENLPPRHLLPVSLHGVNLIDALALGQVMDRLPAAMTIIGVEISSQEPYHEGLMPAVAAAVPAVCRRVLEEIAALRQGGLQ